jgi:hypothetical protein
MKNGDTFSVQTAGKYLTGNITASKATMKTASGSYLSAGHYLPVSFTPIYTMYTIEAQGIPNSYVQGGTIYDKKLPAVIFSSQTSFDIYIKDWRCYGL